MRTRCLCILVMVAGILLSASCVRRPKGVLSDDDMAPVLADMELAEAYIRVNHGVSPDERDAMLDQILAKHKVSRADFDTTMAWYGRNLDKYYDLCDVVGKDLERKKRKMVVGSTEIESADLWPYVRFAYVAPDGASDGLSFSIPTADVVSGQRLDWKMRIFTPADGSALLGVEYDNGQVSYSLSSVRGRKLEVSLQTDTARQVTRIFGNLALDREGRRPVWIDSIALKALPFDSVEYYSIYSQRTYRTPSRRLIPDTAEPDSEE